MADEEDDEALRLAIELSLQTDQPTPATSADTVIDLISDDDDDLDAPQKIPSRPAISKLQQIKVENLAKSIRSNDESLVSRSMDNSTNIVAKPNVNTENAILAPHPSGSTLLGLDRKQMEQERLARLAASKPGQHGNEAESKKRKAELMSRDDASVPMVGLIVPVGTQGSKLHTTGASKLHAPKYASSRAASDGVQYPHGIVKKTWVKGYDRDGSDIKIEEVLQKDSLDLAVLSSFQIDSEWIMGKLNDTTKVVWVLQAKSEAEKENWRDNAPENYRFCFPYMGGVISCMHSKLQLLSHETHLRIAIPSANLVPYDWGETGVMENVCFLIDLPRLPREKFGKPATQFGNELIYFLEASGLDQKIINSLNKFDFSKTAEMAFVHSIGGSHSLEWQRTGYCGLGKAAQFLGGATLDPLEIDFLTASLGNMNEEFIRAMYLACQGDDGLTEYQFRTNKTTSQEAEIKRKSIPDDVLKHCRVYFPTAQTVDKSKGGKQAGGTICLQEKFFDSKTFPRQVMRDCVSKRQGLLMHSKMIFIRGPRSALVYTGSANLSEAAWGKLVTDRKTKQPKLNCRNWECGVLLPVRKCPVDEAQEDTKQRVLGVEVFDGVVPVPMITPGNLYGERKPWFFSQA